MAQKEKVSVSVNVMQLKNLRKNEKFKTVSNNGNVSEKTYTKQDYNQKTKKYNIGNTKKQFSANQKVTTDLINCKK